MKRTPAQRAASRRNLEKARAAKKRGLKAAPQNSGKDKRFTKALAERRAKTSELQKKYGKDFADTPGKASRNRRIGGRIWAANEARPYNRPLSETTEKKLLKKRTRTRVSGNTGKVFSQTRRQAIMGIRPTRKRRKK